MGFRVPRFRLPAVRPALRPSAAPLAALLLAALCAGALGLAGRSAPAAGDEPATLSAPALSGDLAYISAGNVWLQRGAAPPRQLTSSGTATAVRWSPAGTTLLVTEAGHPLFFKADGAIAQSVAGLWTPDDTAVAVAGGNGGVDLALPDGGARATLVAPQPGVDFRPAAWSPDGRLLALNRRTFDDQGLPGAEAVWLVQRDGGDLRELLPAGATWPEALGWSPDGRWLAVWRGPAERCLACRADGQPLAIVSVADGRSVEVGTVVRSDGFCWSADASTFVASVGEGRESYRTKQLVRIDGATGARSVIAGDGGTVAIQPACAADGSGVAFTRGPALAGAPFENLDEQHGYPRALLGGRRIALGAAGRAPWPATLAEEAPRWAGGSLLLTVRWRPEANGLPASAELWLGDTEAGGGTLIAAALGSGGPLQAYFGDLGWSNLFTWHP